MARRDLAHSSLSINEVGAQHPAGSVVGRAVEVPVSLASSPDVSDGAFWRPPLTLASHFCHHILKLTCADLQVRSLCTELHQVLHMQGLSDVNKLTLGEKTTRPIASG
jgi:hypothetical protein